MQIPPCSHLSSVICHLSSVICHLSCDSIPDSNTVLKPMHLKAVRQVSNPVTNATPSVSDRGYWLTFQTAVFLVSVCVALQVVPVDVSGVNVDGKPPTSNPSTAGQLPASLGPPANLDAAKFSAEAVAKAPATPSAAACPAWSLKSIYFGIATADKIPTSTTTMASSISVKPP